MQRIAAMKTALYFYTSSETYSNFLDSAYSKLFTSHNRPQKQVFNLALKGYAKLLEQGQLGKKNILAFIDYSLSANVKRFWGCRPKSDEIAAPRVGCPW
jgi:hypothetical protein